MVLRRSINRGVIDRAPPPMAVCSDVLQHRAHSPNLSAAQHHLFEHRFFFWLLGEKKGKEKKEETGWHFTLRPMNEKTLVHKRQVSQGRKRKAALAHPNHLQCVRENRRDSPAPSMPHHSEAPSSSQHKNASHERRGTDSWKNSQSNVQSVVKSERVRVFTARDA